MEEAAKMLGRTVRSVRSYMKTGLLRRIVDSKKVFIPRTDVEQLQVELGAGFPPMNRKTFNQLVAHVQRLEMDLVVLKRMNGVYDSPLRPTKEETSNLFQACVAALSAGSWTLSEISQWADLFEKMDDVFFEVLADNIGVSDPWRPFYQICVAQMKQLSSMEGYKSSLELQHLHSRLSIGLSTMRRVIMVWIEAGRSEKAHAVATLMDGISEAVLRRLTAKA